MKIFEIIQIRSPYHIQQKYLGLTVLSQIEYSIYQQMKSILKDQAERSKGTLKKAPLRVTFAFDENETQEESAPIRQPFSWITYHPQPIPNEKNNLQEQAKEVYAVKKTYLWNQEVQFRKENIKWNEFVLVYNPKFTLSSFFCGKCQHSFSRTIDFVFHCLTDCGEIANSKSSHFIFDQKQWLSFVDHQRAKAKQLEQSVQKKALPTKKSFEQRKKEIREFTETTLAFWRETGQNQNFIIDRHYQFYYNLVLLLNPLSDDYSTQQLSFYRQQCPMKSKFAKKRDYFVNYHLQREDCCQINTLNANFLILDAGLFHNYLIETGKYKLGDKYANVSCILHMYNQPESRKKVQQTYPKLKYCIPFFELFYGMRQSFQKTKPSIQIIKQFGKAEFFIRYKFWKSFNVACIWETYKDETFYCPCQNFSAAMTISEFAAHLIKNPHHIIKISDIFSP